MTRQAVTTQNVTRQNVAEPQEEKVKLILLSRYDSAAPIVLFLHTSVKTQIFLVTYYELKIFLFFLIALQKKKLRCMVIKWFYLQFDMKGAK